jgi:hypothetical protein
MEFKRLLQYLALGMSIIGLYVFLNQKSFSNNANSRKPEVYETPQSLNNQVELDSKISTSQPPSRDKSILISEDLLSENLNIKLENLKAAMRLAKIDFSSKQIGRPDFKAEELTFDFGGTSVKLIGNPILELPSGGFRYNGDASFLLNINNFFSQMLKSSNKNVFLTSGLRETSLSDGEKNFKFKHANKINKFLWIYFDILGDTMVDLLSIDESDDVNKMNLRWRNRDYDALRNPQFPAGYFLHKIKFEETVPLAGPTLYGFCHLDNFFGSNFEGKINFFCDVAEPKNGFLNFALQAQKIRLIQSPKEVSKEDYAMSGEPFGFAIKLSGGLKLVEKNKWKYRILHNSFISSVAKETIGISK